MPQHETDTPDPGTPDSGAQEHRFHPAVIATAIALPVALIVGIVVAAILVSESGSADDGPVAVGSAPAPDATSEACTNLLAALPDTLGDYTRAELAEPAPDGAAAWRSTDSDTTEPIVLRCGMERPLEFMQGVGLQQVDAVQWFRISGEDIGLDATTWFAVDRPAYVALTLPDGTGPSPIQEISAAITKTMPTQPIDPAPAQAAPGGGGSATD